MPAANQMAVDIAYCLEHQTSRMSNQSCTQNAKRVLEALQKLGGFARALPAVNPGHIFGDVNLTF